jgi:hypothetical protein
MNSKELRALQEAYSQVYELDEAEVLAQKGGVPGSVKVKPALSIPGTDIGVGPNKPVPGTFTTTTPGQREKISKGDTTIDRGLYKQPRVGAGPTANERSRYNTAKVQQGSADRMKIEQVDLYDIILSHLLDEGYADTEEAATVIMVNMSEEWRDSIVEMTDFEAGGGNAKIKKTGMSKDQVIALGQKNLAGKPPSSSNSSNSSNSNGGIRPGDYNINVNFGPKKEPKQQPAAYTPPRSLTRKPYGPATAKSIFQKPDYDVPSFADMKDAQMRSQAQDSDEWLVKAGKQKPGENRVMKTANATIAKQRAYYGQK